ncbi:hypothetical protein SLEP1_g55444 [Rubroshorea leprosula]|uniref:Uncharacterized protein n=1 Tax=Rubroshorea leprosula TaxID=152421 RepID=A0AAV5MGI6_9ROSI|nr:hypothetical protein SLEP1_g55444 [Rubroshorea leprosula]
MMCQLGFVEPNCWVRWKPSLAGFVDQPRLGSSEPSIFGFRRTELCWVRLLRWKPSLVGFVDQPRLGSSEPNLVGFIDQPRLGSSEHNLAGFVNQPRLGSSTSQGWVRQNTTLLGSSTSQGWVHRNPADLGFNESSFPSLVEFVGTQPCWVHRPAKVGFIDQPRLGSSERSFAEFVDQPRLGSSEPRKSGFQRIQLSQESWVRLKPNSWVHVFSFFFPFPLPVINKFGG